MSLDVELYKTFHISYDGGETLEEREECVYSANITHNLNKMAGEAGIYEALWRPHRLKEGYNIPEEDYKSERGFEDENKVFAKEIIEILEKGLKKLKSRPEFFKRFDSTNGWGTYKYFVPFVEKYLKACKEYPEAIVRVDR